MYWHAHLPISRIFSSCQMCGKKTSSHLSCGCNLFPICIQNAPKPKSFTPSTVSLKCHFRCKVAAAGAVKTATLVFSVLTSVCQMFGLLHTQSCLAISLKTCEQASKQTAALATLLTMPTLLSGNFLAARTLSIGSCQTLALGT